MWLFRGVLPLSLCHKSLSTSLLSDIKMIKISTSLRIFDARGECVSADSRGFRVVVASDHVPSMRHHCCPPCLLSPGRPCIACWRSASLGGWKPLSAPRRCSLTPLCLVVSRRARPRHGLFEGQTLRVAVADGGGPSPLGRGAVVSPPGLRRPPPPPPAGRAAAWTSAPSMRAARRAVGGGSRRVKREGVLLTVLPRLFSVALT